MVHGSRSGTNILRSVIIAHPAHNDRRGLARIDTSFIATFHTCLLATNRGSARCMKSIRFLQRAALSAPCVELRDLHTYSSACIFIHARLWDLRSAHFAFRNPPMKPQRLDAIREVLASSAVTSQDELRRKLRRRGFEVTQATLSRDIHALQLLKGPAGYSLPRIESAAAAAAEDDDSPPSVEEMIDSFGLRARQAMNQVVVRTVMGGAQPVAASLDRAGWPEVVGTVAGDDTVLIICPDVKRASDIEARIRTLLES